MAVDLNAALLAMNPGYYYIGESRVGPVGVDGLSPLVQVYAEDNSGAAYTSIQRDTSHIDHFGGYTWAPDTDDAIYFGTYDEFPIRIWSDISNGTSQITATAVIAWEFWNGTTWAAVAGLVDGGVFFKSAGRNNTSWDAIQTGWTALELNGDGLVLFYVRARLASGTYDADVVFSEFSYQGPALWGLANLGTEGPPSTLRYRQITTPMNGGIAYATPCASIITTDTSTTSSGLRHAIQLWDDPPPNEARLYLGPINYQDDFGLSFGFFYRMAHRGHNGNTATGTFPEQLGFTTAFKWQYKGTLADREIEFSIVDEQDNTNELGPYLRLKLYDNNEAAPDNRGLSTGEVFTMTNPDTGGPWRWEYRDEQPLVTEEPDYQYDRNDRTMRLYFVGFSLIKSFLGDGTEYWKCAFYANGRYSVENAAVAEVPHEIMHQSVDEQAYLFNYYDDGSAAPMLTRSTPHYIQHPMVFKSALSHAQWDTIYELAAKQTYGTTGYFDVVTASGPPVRDVGHESILFGSQVRDMHHTHTLFGNARFVPPVITQRFRLTITGALDLTTDVQLPMKSFSVAKSLAEDQRVSFQIPYRDELALAISDRPAGVIKLEFSLEDTDGVPTGFTEYLSAAQGDTMVSEGTVNASISLNGNFTIQAPLERSYTVPRDEIVRERVESGVRELGIKFNEAILPGDTINWTNPEGAQSFEVRTIQLNATAGDGCVMILQEDSGSG